MPIYNYPPTAAELKIASLNGFRLTLESGVPVSTSDQAAKSTIYVTPYAGNVISLWDGARWQPTESAEYAISLTGSGGDVAVGPLSNAKPYDVFAYLSGGALACEVLAWTNGTTRATAVVRTDGVLTKSGDQTRRLLGTFYSTSTTSTTEDTITKRFVWNADNRVLRQLYKQDATAHDYNNASQRYYNDDTANKLEVIYGEDPGEVFVEGQAHIRNDTDGHISRTGSGLDTAAIQSTLCMSYYAGGGTDAGLLLCGAQYGGNPGIGYHYFSMMQQGAATGTHEFQVMNMRLLDHYA